MEALIPNATVFVQMAIFLVAYFALKAWLFDPYMDHLERRELDTTGADDELDALRDEIASAQAQIRDALDQARGEGNDEREQLLAAAAAKADRLMQESRNEAAKHVADARHRLERTESEVLAELKQQLDELAELIAGKLTEQAA